MALRARNAHYTFHSIHARHWHALAMKNGGPPTWQAMLALVGQTEGALADVESRLPRSFPGRTWHTIQAGVRSQVRAFSVGMSELEEARDCSAVKVAGTADHIFMERHHYERTMLPIIDA